MSTITERPYAQAIARTRASIKFFTHQRRTQPGNFRQRFGLCVLHAALNILMGKPNSHVLTLRKSSHGYCPDSVNKAVELYVEDAKRGVFDGPLRLYVLVFSKAANGSVLSTGAAAAQIAHAVAELAHAYGNHPQYLQWLRTDKTIVLLEGKEGYYPGHRLRSYPLDVSMSPVCTFYDDYLKRSPAYAYLPMTQAQAELAGFASLKLLGG